MMLAYSILHYRTTDLTMACVDSILRISPSAHIVVVDNGSGDGSGDVLASVYEANDKVTIIMSAENLGFASGNNIGYEYARTHLRAGIIVVMNNDVMISQPDFESRIAGYASGDGADVFGPDILTPDGSHQNPLLSRPFGTFRLIKQTMIESVRLICLRLGIFTQRILGTYNGVSQSYHRQELNTRDVADVIPHGACLVFGPRYVERMPYAFEPGTFLYCEEMILFDLCRYAGFHTGICSGAQVLHLGGKSTMANAGMLERQVFKISNTLKSMLLMLRRRIFKNYVFLRNNNVHCRPKN